jgi:hypothetical protein
MKRVLALLLAAALVLGMAATALAADRHGHHGRHGRHDRHGHHDRMGHYDRGRYDHDRGGHEKFFGWHDHHRTFGRHHMERIRDRAIERRHPGLHAYRWHGYGDRHEGFWHNGRWIVDAILFFNDDDEVVGFGYMDGGVFIYVREGGGYEEQDPFFFLRWFR